MGVLWILGTPLQESTPLAEAFLETLENSAIIIAETRKVAYRWLQSRPHLKEKPFFFLDGLDPKEARSMHEVIEKAFAQQQEVSLFSDGGMPILFDPGKEILELAQKKNARVRSLPGPTSWSTACAVSGFDTPFLIQGFISQKSEGREQALKSLSAKKETIVLMDTPYRFLSLLQGVENHFAKNRKAFIAWEIGSDSEKYLWTTVEKLSEIAQKNQLHKGEFILIVGRAL